MITKKNNSCVRMAGLAAGMLLGSGATFGDVLTFQVTLDGQQEVPPNASTATGSGTMTLDTATNLFSWNITFSGLGSAQTAAHFHAAAAVCNIAPPVITLPLNSPIIGQATVTEAQEQEIRQGLWYCNIHTTNFPAGEIRGQVQPTAIADPIPGGIAASPFTVRLLTVASGLTAPNWGTNAPGVPGRMFVTDQPGILWNVNLATGRMSAFLDVSSRLVDLGIFGPDTFDERGLLGVAFHPNYQSNGFVYTYTSEPVEPGNPADFTTMPPGSTANHVSNIIEWHVVNPGNPDAVVDPGSARVMLRIDEPQFNHNGGCLNFGPDGMLYISLGDGGAGDDEDGGLDPFGLPNLGHGCEGNGQNPMSILGKLLRIDPLGRNSANGKYGIPADNPFVGSPELDEIWALGLRNPFRFSFDRSNGTLYLADVGQNDIEEINIIESGGHYGWNVKEGSFRFVGNGLDSGYVALDADVHRPDLIDPIAEYDHDEGISAIGGFVYRGTRLPGLVGRYVLGEFARSFALDGRLFHLDASNVIREFGIQGQSNVGLFVLGMGQDEAGELYLMCNATGVPFQDTGVVLQIVPVFELTVSGNCPGVMTARVQGATPNGTVAFIRASGTGSVMIPGGVVCAGTTLGLDRTATLIATAPADPSGKAVISGNVPSGACGRTFVQALDIATCSTSDVEGL